MDLAKRQKLEAAGWTVGTSADFLELPPEEEAQISANADEASSNPHVGSSLDSLLEEEGILNEVEAVAKVRAGIDAVMTAQERQAFLKSWVGRQLALGTD